MLPHVQRLYFPVVSMQISERTGDAMSEARRVKDMSAEEFDSWLSRTVADRHGFCEQATSSWSKWLGVLLIGATTLEQVGKRLSLSMSILDELLHYEGDAPSIPIPVRYYLRMLRQENWGSLVESNSLDAGEDSLDARYLSLVDAGYGRGGYVIWSGQILELAILLGRKREVSMSEVGDNVLEATSPVDEGSNMSDSSSPRDDFWGKPIHTYLVQDALRDGMMVQPFPEMAREAGYRVPIIMTLKAFEALVGWDDSHPTPQDEKGRFWDVLMVSYRSAERAVATPGARIRQQVLAVPRERTRLYPHLLDFEVVFQALNSEGDPCLTILLPEED